jgi:hypothetical protein
VARSPSRRSKPKRGVLARALILFVQGVVLAGLAGIILLTVAPARL